LTLLFPLFAHASTISKVMNSVGVLGEVAGSTDYGSPSGGIGATGGFTSGNWFGNATIRYNFNAHMNSSNRSGGNSMSINVPNNYNSILQQENTAATNFPGMYNHQSTSTYSMSADVRGGYLFHVDRDLAIGPYLGFDYYEYASTYSMKNSNFNISAGNEYIGAGVYAAWSPAARLAVLTYAGGYTGVGKSGNINGFSVAVHSTHLVQTSVKVYYRINGPVYAFAGIQNDYYTGHYGNNILRGDIGMALSY
jgi:hypothetical protein